MTKKINIIKHEGKLDLGGFKIDCYVLEDGTRILSAREMQRALKMVDEDSRPLAKVASNLKVYN